MSTPSISLTRDEFIVLIRRRHAWLRERYHGRILTHRGALSLLRCEVDRFREAVQQYHISDPEAEYLPASLLDRLIDVSAASLFFDRPPDEEWAYEEWHSAVTLLVWQLCREDRHMPTPFDVLAAIEVRLERLNAACSDVAYPGSWFYSAVVNDWATRGDQVKQSDPKVLSYFRGLEFRRLTIADRPEESALIEAVRIAALALMGCVDLGLVDPKFLECAEISSAVDEMAEAYQPPDADDLETDGNEDEDE